MLRSSSRSLLAPALSTAVAMALCAAPAWAAEATAPQAYVHKHADPAGMSCPG